MGYLRHLINGDDYRGTVTPDLLGTSTWKVNVRVTVFSERVLFNRYIYIITTKIARPTSRNLMSRIMLLKYLIGFISNFERDVCVCVD